MARKSPFHDFIWEKDGNGNYVVTDKVTGFSVKAIPLLGKPQRYRIKESNKFILNFYGQKVPKPYTSFEVMEFCRELGTRRSQIVDTVTREG